MTHWWRAYDEAVDDPKLQLLPLPLFRAWFNLLCLASANGGTLPGLSTIAFKLRLAEDKARHVVAELTARGLLDERNGTFAPHNWRDRQFKSDVTDPTAAERMQRHRNGHRNATVTDTVTGTVTGTVTVTPPRDRDRDRDREQITESEKKEPPSLRSGERARKGIRLPADWALADSDLQFALDLGWTLIAIESEVAKFRDYWHARAGPGGVKLDWDATWRNWIRRAAEQGGKGGPNGQQRNPVMAAFDKLIARAEGAEIEERPAMRDVTARCAGGG